MRSSRSSSLQSFEVVSPQSVASRVSSRTLSTAPLPEVNEMSGIIRQYKVAAVQAEPGWFDLEKSVQKTVDLIDEAGKKGCKLIAFPETCKQRMIAVHSCSNLS